jgi:hypothetical protein
MLSLCYGAWSQVEWLKTLITDVKVRLVFESALELMGTTKIGTFQVLRHFAHWVHPGPRGQYHPCVHFMPRSDLLLASDW